MSNPGPASIVQQNYIDTFQPSTAGWNQNNPQSFFNVAAPSGDLTGAIDTFNIMAAYTAAVAVGGGTIQFQNGKYYLCAPLPLTSNIWYRGFPGSYAIFGSTTYVGGTQFNGNGTFDCFDANAVDRGSEYANATVLWNSVIKNCGVRDVVMTNFVNGIKVGGKFNGGVSEFEFSNCTAFACTGWGFWFENCQLGTFTRLTVYGCAAGAIMHRASTTLWNFGNYTTVRENAQSGYTGGLATIQTRGIVHQADGSSVQLNYTNAFDTQSNGNSFTSTQAATMTNTSANIGVTDLSKFAVNMPVYFSATVNNFVTQKTYFVTSVAGSSGAGNITVASTFYGGSNIVASGNSAVNIVTNGMPGIELIGTNGGTCTSHKMVGIDCETNGGIVWGNASSSFMRVNRSTAYSAPANDITCCNLGFDCLLDMRATYNGGDFTASQYMRIEGKSPVSSFASSAGGGPFYITGVGMAIDAATSNVGMHLQGVSSNALGVPADFYFNKSTNFLAGGFPIQTPSTQQGSTTWNSSMGDVAMTVGLSTLTIPAAAAGYVGTTIFIMNTTGGNTTVSLASGNFTGLGSSASGSITLATLTGCLIKCMNVTSPFWARFI